MRGAGRCGAPTGSEERDTNREGVAAGGATYLLQLKKFINSCTIMIYDHPNEKLFFEDTVLRISILFERLRASSQSENANTHEKRDNPEYKPKTGRRNNNI